MKINERCQKCGQSGTMILWRSFRDDEQKKWCASCTSCGHKTGAYADKEDAISEWDIARVPKRNPVFERCPDCGQSNSVHVLQISRTQNDATNAPERIAWKIACTECGYGTLEHVSREDAVEVWNKESQERYW